MKVVHCKHEAYDTYIGRPSKWGNPFVIGKDGSRQEVIEKYRKWIRTQPQLLKDLPELKNKTLGCWCRPLDCHGDVLVELVKSMDNKPQKIKLSASKIKTLQSCTWTYYAQYILKLPQSPNTGASRGLCAHIVLECLINPRHRKYVHAITQGEPFPASLTRLILKHARKLKIATDENLEMIEEMVITAINYDFLREGAASVQAEEEFRIETDKYLINGFIDKLAVYPDGTLEITDYKTSKAKFSKEELESNMQAMMYSLAILKNKGKIPKVKFLFLRFPKQPLQEPKQCSPALLRGFETFLSGISSFLSKFTEKSATDDMAANDQARRWLCGKEGLKKDGTKAFICQYRKPFHYFAIINKENKVVATAFEKKDLKPGPEDKIEKLFYGGCPAFRKNVSNDDDTDPFDF